MAAPRFITELTAVTSLSSAAAVHISQGGLDLRTTAGAFITQMDAFTASGSGAGPRTVQAKAREIVSITDFYANGVTGALVTGDGVTDCTGGIQAAIDAQSSIGGIVYIPPGNYVTTADITVPNGITLQGAGINKQTSRISPSSAVTNCFKSSNFGSGNNSQIIFRDFSIVATYGDIEAYVALQGFWFELSNLKLEGHNATTGGVRLLTGQYATLHNIIILGHASAGTAGTGYGVVCDNFNTVLASSIDIEGCAVGLDLINGSHGCNITGRYEICPIGVQVNGNDNVLSGIFADCASRWANLAGTSRNNRVFISRESDTNVPSSPVLIASGAEDNWIFTDEAVADNASKNVVLGTSLALNTKTIRQILTFTSLDATPSVAKGNLFKTANTGPTTITGFDDGSNGQEITIYAGDSATTIDHNAGAGLYLDGAADFAMTEGDTLTLIRVNNAWFEVGRGNNT